jgi:hypothetical protein
MLYVRIMMDGSASTVLLQQPGFFLAEELGCRIPCTPESVEASMDKDKGK